METLFEQWIESLNARSLSVHTIRNYGSDVKQFLKFYANQNIDPVKLNRDTARLYLTFLAGKYANKASIMRKRDAVNQFYKFLKAENHIARNEFQFFDRIKLDENLPKFMTQEEAAALLISAAQPDDDEFAAARASAMLELMYSCGTRAQETVNLNWTDIDWRAGFIRVNNGKGRKDRIIPIGETAITALWEYGKIYQDLLGVEPAGLSPIFVNTRGDRITTRSLGRIVEFQLKRAGIDAKVTPHVIRHSFATHCIQNGMKIMEIAKCLGHASVSTTQRYTHLTMKEVLDHYDMAHPRA